MILNASVLEDIVLAIVSEGLFDDELAFSAKMVRKRHHERIVVAMIQVHENGVSSRAAARQRALPGVRKRGGLELAPRCTIAERLAKLGDQRYVVDARGRAQATYLHDLIGRRKRATERTQRAMLAQHLLGYG